MAIIVTDIFKSSSCPKYLQPVVKEFGKTPNYAFEDRESLLRLASGCRDFVQVLTRKRNSRLMFQHDENENGDGSLTIGLDSVKHPFLILRYISLRGHIHVSKDGMTLSQHNFIKEDTI